MMKKVLSLLVVMCIIIGMLPVIALAVDSSPEVFLSEFWSGSGWDSITLTQGQTKYFAQEDTGDGYSRLVETYDAVNYVLKYVYAEDGEVTAYVNGLNMVNPSGYGITLAGNSGDYKWNFAGNINMVIEKDSSYTVEGGYYGGFDFYCVETVTISSVDGAKLTLSGADTSTDSAFSYPMDYQGTLVARGDLVIDSAVLDITANENYGIFVGNSLTITDSEVEITADEAAFNKAPIFGKGLDVVAATVQAPEDADLVEYVKADAASYKYVKIAAANDDEGGEVEPGLLEEFLFEYWNGSGWGATEVNPGEATVYFVQAKSGEVYSYLTTEGADANNYVLKIEYPADEAVTVYFNGLNMVQPGGWGVLFESATNSADVNLVIEADSSYTLDGEGYYGGIECYTSKTFTISSVDGAQLTAAGQDTSADGLSGAATIWHRGNLVIDGAALDISADEGHAIGAVGTITIKDSDVVACSETMAAFNKAPIFGKGLDVVAATVQAPEDADLVEYVKADAATYRYVKITVNEEAPEEPEVPVEPAYKFSNTVTCNETLDLNFYLPKDAVPMAATWIVTYGGNVLEEGEYSLDLQSDGRMRVRVSYYPHQLNNEVTVICKDANGVVLAQRSNSIQGYCMAYLGLTNGKALDRALMVAMLEYGSWAQIGVSSADPLANRDLTAAHKAYLTDYAWPASGAPTIFAENNQTLDYTFSCSVTCNETLDLNFYLNANATDQAASWTVTIDGEEVSEGKYMISKDAKNRWRIRVSFLGNQMNSLVSVTCKDAGGNVIAQRSNSIREYAMLYLAQSSATTRDSALMVAMLEFGSLAQIGLGQTNVLANYLLDDTYRANLTHTHNYSSEVTAPTCTEKGYTTYTCSCGHTYTANPTAAKGHSYSEATCTKAATCACGAVNGTPLGHFYNYGICSRCDAADPNYNEPAPGEPGFVWKIATTTGDLVGYGDYDTDADAIRGLYDAGFRYIDFSMYSNLTSDSVYMSENWREEVLKLKAVADELGMTFVQAHSPGGNLLTTNQSEANELIAATKRSVEICEVLGIRNLVVHIGWRDGLTREQWMQQNKIMYNNFLPLAEECGVNILCENSTVKNMGSFEYLSTGAEMREFVEYVDHPNFHACWDTGHANCDNLDQYQNIVDIGDELYAIHYAENDGSYDSHVMPFFGTVNHNDIMRALVEIGFRGPFVLECDGGSRTSNTYTGPAFDWIKEELNVTDPTNPSVLGRLNRAQQEKLLFDIANYIVTTYPTTAP